jgi:hypothetical protein
MAVLSTLAQHIDLLSGIASFLVFLNLARLKLLGSYKAFGAFLLIHGGLLLVVSTLRPGTNRYAYTYLYGQGLLWLVYLWVVVELYQKVLTLYPAIVGMAKYVVVLAMGASLVGSPKELSAGNWGSDIILRHMAIQRAVTAAMCLHMILLTWFLGWLLVRLPRNTVYHTVLFFFYFLAEAIGNLYRILTGVQVDAAVNLGLQICTLLAFVGWMVLIQEEGEALPQTEAYAGSSSAMIRAMEQVNRSLSRGARH